jgi:DNA-binding beta-propeller fold protein YncE
MAMGRRIATFGLLLLSALGAQVGAAAGDVPARASVGFAPIPLSVAADGGGHVYLSDPLSSTVLQYSSEGDLLANLGSFAVSGNPFQPRGIATDTAGLLYVADAPAGEIVVLGGDGGVLRQWGATGGRDLAVGPDGTVYLAGSREIRRFSADGTLLSTWGGPGNGFGEVRGIDTSPNGLVYVADTYGNRIVAFTADGTFLTEWGGYGKGEGEFIYPYGIALSAAGEVYVADTVNDRVQRFSADGAFLGSWGGSGRARGRFYTPTSITTDPAGYVYVADRAGPYPEEGRARVQKFSADGQFVKQWYDSPPPSERPRLTASIGHTTTKRSATFRFRSRLQNARFICKLTGERVPRKLRKWRSCSSPKRYARLQPGRKVFHVSAVDGSAVGREASYAWRILRLK